MGRSSSPGRVKKNVLCVTQTGSGIHPASSPMGTWGSFPGHKSARVWSWPLTSTYTYLVRERASQGNWQPQFPRIPISLSCTHYWMEQFKLRKRQRNSWKAWKLNFQATEHASRLTVALPRDFLMSTVLYRASVIHLFLTMARKVEEAAKFVLVQLIEQEPGIY
jgi:hypothetical protein